MKNTLNKINNLQFKQSLVLIFSFIIGIENLYATYDYDFSAVAPSGQTLYYDVICADCLTVGVVSPNIAYQEVSYVEGDLIIPSEVEYNGETYTVTTLLNNHNEGSFQQTNITSLVLPATINDIDGASFYRCNRLTAIYVYAKTPPSLDGSNSSYTFSGVPTNCEIHVPYGTTGLYQNAWGSYIGGRVLVNMEPEDGEITAIISPEGAGTLSGTGIYEGGDICVLTAIANTGYGFCHWLEYDTIASTESTYSFMVNGDRDLVANFASVDPIVFVDTNVKDICIANWDTNNDGELSYFEAAVVTTLNPSGETNGSVFKGNTTITSFDELQYFIGLSQIDNRAFSGCSGLTSVEIPNSVTTIGDYAFSGCSGLTTVEIPNSVTTIGDDAFRNCSGLTTVEIPNSVTTIGDDAFRNCSGLTSMNYTGDIAQWCEISFSNEYSNPLNYAHNLYVNNQLVTDLVIPNSVTTIGYNAFSRCTSLTSVTIGNSVTSIGDYAFYYCTGLTGDLVIPNSVTTIGRQAFYASGQTSVTIGNSVTTIGSSAFSSAIETVYFNANNCTRMYSDSYLSVFSNINSFTLVIGDNVNHLPQYAFSGCSGLTGELVIPNSVTTIGSYAFLGCSGLTGELVIPNSVTTISVCAFQNCSGLTSVEIPNSVTTIGINAFYGCSGLTSVEIPNSVTTIGSSAFRECSGLTSVAIGNSVTTIGGSAFQSCGLTGELVIPNSVTSIGGYAFSRCSGLTSVTIGNSVTTIGDDAFGNCSGLTSVTIGNSVTSIGNYAFYNCNAVETVFLNAENCTRFYTFTGNSYNTSDPNKYRSLFSDATSFTLVVGDNVCRLPSYAFKDCSGLTSVTIGNSVTSIGDYAFRNCSGLTSVYYTGDIAQWCGITFDSKPSNPLYYGHNLYIDNQLVTELVIPNSVTTIGSYAFSGCNGLTSVTIGNSVATIGGDAFYGCSRMTSMVVLAETPPTVGNIAFSGVSTGIPVYVPCGFADTYRSTSGWSSFTNIIDACPFEVNVTINPSGAATIEGAGTYTNLETCTLSYEALYGYTFLNWMENGEVVSTDDTYSFVVTEDHDITANFQYIEQHWPLPQGYEGNMTLTGIITIDGEEQTSDFIELAAFIGDECHGTALPINVNGQRVYFLTIMGDNADEGVALEFKLYDHQQQEELDLLCTNTVNYQHDAVFGLDEFYVLNFLNYVVITATADPAEGGTIEGAGNHFPGLEATLTATANTGYTFQNWTKNGTVVSTNAAYTFTVTEAESYVAHFTLNSYDLTVSADPTEGGSVTGGGTYNHFDECTLTATANTGYTFQNWTLNDEVVSTDAEYTFEVSGGGEYVAHFQLNSYEIAATADPAEGGTIDGAGTYNHFETCTLTATAATGYTFQNWTLNNEEVSTATELSFEVNAPAAYVAHFTLNSYEITAIANPAEGGTVSGSGTYDHFASCTLSATAADGYQFNRWVADGTTVSTDATYTFEVSGPATITAMFDLVQTVTLSNGWTWWGTSVELTSLGNDGGLGVLEQGLGDYGIIIKHGTQYAQNYSSYGYGWMGTLSKLENEKGYKIQTTQSCNVTITGPLADPDDHPIELIQGWNWIGYPVEQTQSVSSALAGLTPTSGDIIKGQGPFSTYYEGMGWLPEFNLEPGKGYLYYSGNEENQTFTYANAGSKSAIVAVDDRHWRNDVHAYADNLCLWAVVSIGGEEQRTESLELGAFVDGECRGSAKLMYVAPFDRYYALMTVAGESGETIEFALLDEAHNQVSTDCTCHITFVNDAIVGGFETPYQVDFGTMTVIEEYASNLYMYPNPVARNAAFNLVLPEDETVAELYIVDMKGAVVRHETGAISHHSISGLPTSGLYVIRAVCKSGKVYQSRLAVD